MRIMVAIRATQIQTFERIVPSCDIQSFRDMGWSSAPLLSMHQLLPDHPEGHNP